ncbi:MAG: NUDIX domain-containing protein [Chloroflexi bacterium]|nr:MAG: NUDIX domain-containing protein [Chloroflexota bacterium]
MVFSTNGIITNEKNEVLLILRRDSRTWAPAGGGLDFGELPPDGAEREVFEETGLNVKAHQLVGVYFWPNRGEPFLTFSFRCVIQGGDLTTSWETPQVRYFPINRLPWLLLPFHHKRVTNGIDHAARSPYWGVQHMKWYEALGVQLIRRVWKPYRKLWFLMHRGVKFVGEYERWVAGAFVVVRNEAGGVLWVKRTDMDFWNLPGGGGHDDEPPWETAVRETYEETGLHVNLTDLSGVYLYDDKRHVIFVFTAVIESGQLTTGSKSAAFAYFAPGHEPENVFCQHVERAADACYPRDGTVFRFQNSGTDVNEEAVQLISS